MSDMPRWCQVSVPPRLERDRVHVWRFSLAPDFDAAPTPDTWLSPDERERAASYLRAEAGERFRRTRALLRWVLAGYLDTRPGALVFAYGAQGKPALADGGQGLGFNLSHSGDLALLAVARDLALGLDLERLRPRAHLLGIARRVFDSGICRELEELDPEARLARFFHHWTALEARVKADGNGLFRRPAGVQAQAWPLRHFTPQPGYLAALAASSPSAVNDDWVWLEPPQGVIAGDRSAAAELPRGGEVNEKG